MEGVDTFMGIIVPYTNAAIFLGLAIYFFRNPARKAALQKQQEYELLVAEASKAKAEAEARLHDLKHKTSRLDSEIAEIKQTAQAAAQIEADRIVSDAEALAKHLKDESQRIADVEVDKAKNLLRKEILELVEKEVTKKLRSDVDGSQHANLISQRVEKLQGLSV